MFSQLKKQILSLLILINLFGSITNAQSYTIGSISKTINQTIQELTNENYNSTERQMIIAELTESLDGVLYNLLGGVKNLSDPSIGRAIEALKNLSILSKISTGNLAGSCAEANAKFSTMRLTNNEKYDSKNQKLESSDLLTRNLINKMCQN